MQTPGDCTTVKLGLHKAKKRCLGLIVRHLVCQSLCMWAEGSWLRSTNYVATASFFAVVQEKWSKTWPEDWGISKLVPTQRCQGKIARSHPAQSVREDFLREVASGLWKRAEGSLKREKAGQRGTHTQCLRENMDLSTKSSCVVGARAEHLGMQTMLGWRYFVWRALWTPWGVSTVKYLPTVYTGIQWSHHCGLYVVKLFCLVFCQLDTSQGKLKKKKLPSNWPVGKSMGQLLDWPKPMPHPQPVPPLVSACSFPVWLPWFLSSIPSCSHAFPWFGMLLSYLTVTREKGASGASRESHLLGVEARGDMFRPYGE